MASPGDKKGQRRGLCGHIMASFDLHKRCARCRDKGIGDDDCVAKRSCVIKRPARDACLCMGELPAPHFVFLITL